MPEAPRPELVVADIRAIADGALDGVDGVINLAGLSNDPTAEFDPKANWEMNALATEALGRVCVERGIDRFVFASSCSPRMRFDLVVNTFVKDAPLNGRIMLVAGSVQLTGRRVTLHDVEAPELTRNYERSASQ